MEECDDGNLNGGKNSFCDTSCKRTSGSCGNGIIESRLGEDCEPSLVSARAPLACSSSCKYIYGKSSQRSSSASILLADACAGNECSLGGSDFCGAQSMTCEAISDLPCLQCVGGACTTDADCTNGAVCRDGTCVLSLTPGVAGSPRTSGSSATSHSSLVSAASSAPLFVAMAGCGNGQLNSGEQCDQGAENSAEPNAFCRPDCTFGRCGDGVVDTPLELCDLGSQNGTVGSPCTALCRYTHNPTTVLPAVVIELPFMPSGSNLPGTVTGTVQYVPGQSVQPPENAATGPATLAIMAAGAAGGYAWMRRRKNL